MTDVGRWQGTWQLRDHRLRLRPFTTLRSADRDALLAEADGLREFIAPQAAVDIVIDQP